MIEGEGFFMQNQAQQSLLPGWFAIGGTCAALMCIQIVFFVVGRCKDRCKDDSAAGIELLQLPSQLQRAMLTDKEIKVWLHHQINVSELANLDDTCVFNVLHSIGLGPARCVTIIANLRATG